MPLIQASPPSSIGSVFLTHNALTGGDWTHVDWQNWSRLRKLKTETYASDGTPIVYMVGVGTKGPVVLRIPSCPAALYTALRALADVGTHYTATLKHSVLGTKTLEVEVKSVLADAGDEGYISGDPPGAVTVTLVSFGAAA